MQKEIHLSKNVVYLWKNKCSCCQGNHPILTFISTLSPTPTQRHDNISLVNNTGKTLFFTRVTHIHTYIHINIYNALIQKQSICLF